MWEKDDFMYCNGILCVLGSARTGLIFTRIQEGAQPGGLAQPQPRRVFHTMCHHAGFWWGGGAGGTHSRLGRAQQWFGPRQRFCSAGLFCVFPLSLSLLLLFPLFAVLLNCPYPDSPVSACFFPFSSTPRQGEGRPRGAFVAGRSPSQKINLVPKCGAGITAGLSSVC